MSAKKPMPAIPLLLPYKKYCVRIFLDPVIEDGEVLAHDALIALEHHVAVAQGDGRDRIVEHAAAN